jgi:hypothetical protein
MKDEWPTEYETVPAVLEKYRIASALGMQETFCEASIGLSAYST